MEVNTFKQTFCNLGFGIHTRGGVNSSVDASAPSKSCALITFTPNWCHPQMMNNIIVCHMLFRDLITWPSKL